MPNNDNIAVTTPTEVIKSLLNEQTKQHTVFDAEGRPKFLFEAPVAAKEGTPCLCVEYLYLTTPGTTVRSRQERIYEWKDTWDNDFIFDPANDIDPDGDGSL